MFKYPYGKSTQTLRVLRIPSGGNAWVAQLSVRLSISVQVLSQHREFKVLMGLHAQHGTYPLKKKKSGLGVGQGPDNTAPLAPPLRGYHFIVWSAISHLGKYCSVITQERGHAQMLRLSEKRFARRDEGGFRTTPLSCFPPLQV